MLQRLDSEIDAETAALVARLAPTPAPRADATAAAAEITRAAGSSFGPGMRALPAPRRRGMWALYAFSRVIDDIADEPMPLAERQRLLAAWRDEIEALYAGRPSSAIGQALSPAVHDYALPKAEFLMLIEGMEMDAEGPILAPDMATLRGYTRRVAGAVGLISMRIFGAWRGGISERFALSLGDALQLANIIRDVAEDAERGRLYLPREMLARHGIAPDPSTVLDEPALPALLSDIARLARAEFDAARAAMPGHPRLRLVPALMMLGVYERTLNALEDSRFAPQPRLRLGKGEKLAAALRAVIAPDAFRRATG